MTNPPPPSKRCRVRDLGLSFGRFRPGRFNAITDVGRIRVGHSTLISDSPRGPVRTGVTAILPNDDNVYLQRVVASGFVLNGAGEVSGLTQVMEWGLLETPILLTNTFSVGACGEAVVDHLLKRHPGIGVKDDVVIPVVGECDDSWLNDIAGRHVRPKHVLEAVENASAGPVEEGNVGGGTGMITCGFKGGIGTSSRRLHTSQGGYTLGALVMSNFGEMEDLSVAGIPAGRILAPAFRRLPRRKDNYGSIIAVLATNAPLLPHQLTRLAKRAALGIGRVGSYAAHESGEIVLAFSTANTVPRESDRRVYRLKVLLDRNMNPLYQAAVEATEEAILNALCASEAMSGMNGNFSPALPLDELRALIARFGRDFSPAREPDELPLNART